RIPQPAPDDDLEALEQPRSPAPRRLAFDELFLLHLGLALRRQGVKHEPGIAFQVDGERLGGGPGALSFPPPPPPRPGGGGGGGRGPADFFPSRSPARRPGGGPRSPGTWRGPSRCTGCSRATWGRG